MIITFTNVIGAIRNAISSVITTNLKMWLGFETSVTLNGILDEKGPELVVDGDFPTGTTAWDEGSDTTISNNEASFDGALSYVWQDILEVGKMYECSVRVKTWDSGAGFSVSSISTGAGTNIYKEIIKEDNTTTTFTFTAVSTTLGVGSRYIPVKGSIDLVSVKELTQITPDKSGNNNVGELFTGKALDFNGSTDYVTADGFAGTLSTDDAFTIVMWFKSNQVSQSQPYQNIQMSGAEDDVHTNVFKFGASANLAEKGIHYQDTPGSSHNKKINDTVNYNDNVWHRLVISRQQGSGYEKAKFYVDGGFIGEENSQIRWDDLAKFSIGQEYDNGNVSDEFGGLISDVQIYDKDWLQADVTYDYANPQNLVTDRSGTSIELTNLKAYWAMSEGAGSIVYDSSGEGNNGTINGATYEPAQPRIPQLGMMNWSKTTIGSNVVTLIPNPNNTSQDIFGNAVRDRLNSFNLDGSGYAEVAEVLGLDVTDFSIEAWVKFDYKNSGSSTNVIYVNGGVSTSVNTFALATDEDNKVRFIVGGVTLYSTTVFSNNNWVHIAGTRESGALKLYINGNKTPQATGTGSAVVNNTLDLLVGRDTQTNRFYKERISDVRLYSSALSADEVENNYNAGLSAHTND